MIFNLFAKADSNPRAGEIGFEELRQVVESDASAIVDVREPHEFAGGHIAGAVNLPLSQFDPARLPKGRPLVIHCQSGMRSAAALSQTLKAGISDVRHYAGGMKDWRARGGAIVK